MSKRHIQIPDVFRPLMTDPGVARFKCAWGGRGSGKSHFFALYLVMMCLKFPGTRAVCIREHQRSLRDSSKALIEDKIRLLEVGERFGIRHDHIYTPGGGNIIFVGMKNNTAEGIKSLEGARYAWADEAQALTEKSLDMLEPTIRTPDSELWFSWNPTRKADAVEKWFRGEKPRPKTIIVKANYSDNPWFPEELDRSRQHDEEAYPERYGHKWLGEYAKAFEGAYYARQLNAARREGRVKSLVADPLLPLRLYWDIGGAGASSDATAIWVIQFTDDTIRVLDVIEKQNQRLDYFVNWARDKGYIRGKCILPHDGINANNVTGKRYADHVKDAGFKDVQVIPNQGSGAAKARIEATNRILPRCLFNKDAEDPVWQTSMEAGLQTLGFYHEKRNDITGVGLGPEHDWSSHLADAFGLMAITYNGPDDSGGGGFNRDIKYPKGGIY